MIIMDDYLDPCIFIFEIMSDEDEFMNIEQLTNFACSNININNKRSAVPKVKNLWTRFMWNENA
jgi:hypothetical protein